MERFLSILTTFLRVVLVAVIIFVVMGFFWIPKLESGAYSGPFWLIDLYDEGIEFIFWVSCAGLVLILLVRSVMVIWPGASPSNTSLLLRNIVLWIIGVSAIGAAPYSFAQYDYLQQYTFDDVSYHLMQRQTSNTAAYYVFACTDPMGIWCRQTIGSPPLPAPPPTPTPLSPVTAVDENGDEVIIATPPAVPTVTPPARFVTDTLGIELSIQIGSLRAPITHSQTITEALNLD